jgi:hypothetical protein
MALDFPAVHMLARARFRSLACGLGLMVFVTGLALAATSPGQSWNFDADPPNSLPAGFQIGTLFDGRPAGDWKVVSTVQAKSSPNVLAQLQNKGAEHAYKLVWIEGTQSSNVNVTVSFFAVDGKADMGGGVIWRAADDRHYYLTRANPLEQNVRIYRVVKGVRHMLQNSDHTIEVNKWHTLGVLAKGCRLQVSYDDKPVFDLCDHTFKEGKIGLWTKSDAVTYFDDLHLHLLP